MKTYFTLICVLLTSFSQAQINKKTQASIRKIVGSKYTILPNQKSYPYSSINEQCTFHPSITQKYDTSGISFNNEYVLFRSPIGFKVGSEVLKLMKPTYVTVNEYLEFQNYIRDSIARENIYYTVEDDKIASKFIQYEDTYYNRDFQEMKKFNPSARHENRYISKYNGNIPRFIFDWTHDFSYDDGKLKPYIANMYMSHHERIYKIRAFDERKLIYNYTDHYEQFDLISAKEVSEKFKFLGESGEYKSLVPQLVNSLSDTYYWSTRSTFDRDEFSILGQVYNQLNLKDPVVGINGMQVNAFCHWKQVSLQQKINHKGLNYKIVVTPPTFEDISADSALKMNIPEKDYTAQWRITAEEYQKFISSTRDSILREVLYQIVPSDSMALKLLNYTDVFFDDMTLMNVQFSEYFRESDRLSLRWIGFPLNYKYKINRESFNRLAGKVMDSIVYQNPHYEYSYFDAKERSIVGKLINDSTRFYRYQGYNDDLDLYPSEHDSSGEIIGKDLNMGFTNILQQSSGVRGYENLRRLIHQKTVSIVPDNLIDVLVPKSLILGITYEQAIAFYYWKYPIWKAKPTDDWQNFVLPSEEQFRKVQHGESVVVPAREVNYPTPVFRYVVHVFPLD